MLKQNIKRNGYWMLIRSRLRLRKIMSALTLGFLLGVCVSQLLAMKQALATEVDSPTLTMVSVSQNGVESVPVWDDYLWNSKEWDFGDYYYPIQNNTDMLRIGVRVDGLEDGKTYRLFYDQEITSEYNGQVIYRDVQPYVRMEDSVTFDEFGNVNSQTGDANEYYVSVSLEDEETGYYVGWLRTIVRPMAVGSKNIEILSVKQDGTEVYLDTVGRQVKDLDVLQTINEYQLVDYTKPISLTLRVKNLEVGKHYYGSIGNTGNSFDFVATDTEMEGTIDEIWLDTTKKHLSLGINIYGYSSGDYVNQSVYLYFRILSEDFVPLGSVFVDEISQGGKKIAPTVTDSYAKIFSFRVNDVQNIALRLHADSATDGMTYYIGYQLSSSSSYNYVPTVWSSISGAELQSGTTITIPPRLDEADASPFRMHLYVTAVNESYNGDNYYYIEDDSFIGGHEIRFDFFEDENLPRYIVAYGYANYPDIPEDAFLGDIDARYHDENNPLKVRIEGMHYVSDTVYAINISVNRGGDEYWTGEYAATGAELNSAGGKTIVLSGLTLSGPEIDLDSDDPYFWSQMESSGYDFNIDVNGLAQGSRGGFYRYQGRVGAMITYPGGKVNAIPGRNGIGGGPYISFDMANVSGTALGGEDGAVLTYLGYNFDNEASYQYALYYNGTSGDYDSVAGRKIEEGVMTGRDLNDHKLSIRLLAPEGETNGVYYNLAIRKDGNLVTISRCRLEIYDGPRIETFKINNDAEDYTQIGPSSYAVVRGTDISATVKGSGFDDADSVLMRVEITGYSWDDELEEEIIHEFDDLSVTASISGHDLDNGYTHTIQYDSRFEGYDHIEVYYSFPEDDEYIPGHAFYVEYVDEERVSEIGGSFHIDENGGLVLDDNGEPGEPGDEVPVDNVTGAIAHTSVEGGVLTVTADKACMAVGVKGGVYTLLESTGGSDGEGSTKTRTFEVSGFDEVKVVLKGDGDMDGVVSSSDTNLINRSLISPTLGRRYRALNDLERVLFDLDGDGVISSADVNIINKSLISPTMRPYKAIQW